MANPFKFGAPVQGEQFTGRKREVADIVARVHDHLNIVVISPRRFGKTSLMDAVCNRITGSGGCVARVNAMTASDDLGVFASRFVSSAYAARGPWHKAKESITSFLSTFRQFQPSVSIGTSGPQFSFAADVVQRDPIGIIGNAYALLASATTPLIFIDEFQELTRLPGNLAGLFKAMADEHGGVSLVIAGSKEHMMRDLTLDSRGPLYGMMHAVQLGPIAVEDMGDFVQRRFNIGGKPISQELADRIVSLAGPVPNDIQHLSYDVFAAALADREVQLVDVTDGMDAASDHEASVFADTYANLTTNQRRVLSMLAATPTTSPQARSFVVGSGYANPSGVMRALRSLSESGVVTLRDGTWVVVSPFLRHWLTRTP